MQVTLHDHHTSISTGGRPTHNLRRPVDINHKGGNNGELKDVTKRLVDRATAYGMEVSTEKSKIMTKAQTTSMQILA